MSEAHPRDELRRLREVVKELRTKFLKPYLGKTTLQPPSRGEVLDVAAFAVLVHGHLENYFEGLAYWRLEWAVDEWTQKKPVRRATATLLWHCPAPDYEKPLPIVFDGVREALAAGKKTHSDEIKANHGIGFKHLRGLFYSLGVDLPTDPAYEPALDQLIKVRHRWAHQWRYGAKIEKPASEIVTIVGDCMDLATELCARVVRRVA